MFIKNNSVTAFAYFSNGYREVALAPSQFVEVNDSLANQLVSDFSGQLVATEATPGSGSPVSGTGTPVSVVTPDAIGQTYTDTSTTPQDTYRATGLTSADRELVE